ncbi:uncharacterized protein LOC121287606 [Carcharodon carcharias]|uniref:uncharacterized protein LOC121287606 n=1 Tax=Carcharodon carcharias TaxID=13397 RepID=UPI001B7DEEA2|nr:uncharacterized protein LOC121287606 [Carcharodon carcharias]
MEKDQRVEIGHEKIDEKRNENKEREKERERVKDHIKERDRDRERRRSKHKESKKAERREIREKEENIQRRATGGEARIDKKEDEAKRKDYEGHMMDHGNGAIIVQTPMSCHEENLIIKEGKPGKTLKSASVHNTRGATADIGSKGRSGDEKHASGQPHHRGERDSRGGGEKILERWEKVSIPGTYPEPRNGISENHRSMSVEGESWGDPSSQRPKYSYRANMDKGEEEGNRHHHEKHYSPSPESLTEPSCRIAHIMHSNFNSPDPKVIQGKHRSADKPPRPESKDSNRRRGESRQSPNVHLYMSELVPHPFETKNQTFVDGRPPTEHGKRKSRRSSKEESANGMNTQGLQTTDEETLNVRDDKMGKLMKARSESPRDIPADMGSKGRSRDDKYFSGHIQPRVERDSKGGGEKILERSEKVPLFSSHLESRRRVSENHTPFSVEDESWGEPYISPSSQRPKYSYRASMDKGEEIRYAPDKYSYSTPAEPNLRVSQKMEYTVISNIKTPEIKRKHIKHKSLVREHMTIEPDMKELNNIQPVMIMQSPDIELGVSRSYSKADSAVEQIPSGFADISLSPDYPGRKTQKISRDKNSTAINAVETWNSPEFQSTAANETDEYSQGGSSLGAIKCLEGWGKGLVYEPQFETKQGDRCSDGSPEKKETYPVQWLSNSRRPRYSYGTNRDVEDESVNLLKKSIAHLSQVSDQPVLRITNKSEYMVSSTSTSPEMNRKLIKYTSSLEDQPSALSNFINKAKQLEIATTMQPVSAYESSTVPCPLNSDSSTKDDQQANELDYGGSNFIYKTSVPGSQVELSSTNSQDRPREWQRGVYSKPNPHDLPDGDTHRERKETVSGDVKLMASQSSTSLRQRAVSSLGMTLTDGTLSVDIPRPIVSASRKNLLGTTYNTEMVSNKVRSKPVHFKHQYQECQKRSLQTRKRYQEEVKAALMIQAAWKGYQTRAQIRKQAEAAVIIQAAYRGYQIRKFLTEGISENEMDELNDLQNEDWQNSEYPDVFLEEISQSDYSESDADSTEDWLESPVSMIMGSPGSYGNESLVHEGSPIDVGCPNPLPQYESVYQSQTCNWGGI